MFIDINCLITVHNPAFNKNLSLERQQLFIVDRNNLELKIKAFLGTLTEPWSIIYENTACTT